MKKLTVAGVALALAGALVAGLVCAPLEPRGPAVPLQAAAPEFQLDDQDGQPVSLAGLLADGPAVVTFYRGHW